MLLNRCEYVAWVSRSFWWAASTLRRTAILHCWKMRNNRKIPPQTPIHVLYRSMNEAGLSKNRVFVGQVFGEMLCRSSTG